MAKNSFWKSLKGFNSVGFICDTTSYTDSATYGAFVTEAAEGEIGVFLVGSDGVDATATDKTDALAAGDEFFVAQKLGNSIRKSQRIKFNDCKIRQTDYQAPVANVVHIGYDGNAGTDLNLGTPAAGDIYSILIKDLQLNNEPYPSWQYTETRKVSSAETTYRVLSRLAAKINDPSNIQHVNKGRIATAVIITSQAETDFANTITVANGSTLVTIGGAHSLNVGDYAHLNGDVYEIIAVPSSTTLTLDRPFQGASVSALAAATAEWGSIAAADLTSADALGLQLTALDGAILAVSRQEALENADLNNTTPGRDGHGTYEQVAELEASFNFYDGHTAQNTIRPQNFGNVPVKSVAGETYDIIVVTTTVNYLSTAHPNTVANQRGAVVIVSPNGAGPTSSLKTVLPAT